MGKDHLYFVAPPPNPNGSRWVKIGRASNLVNRLQSLQCGCPFPLEILYVKIGAGLEEYEHHRNLANVRGIGEWFLFSANDVSKLCSTDEQWRKLFQEQQENVRVNDRKRKRSRKRLENPEYRERQRKYLQEYRDQKRSQKKPQK